MLCRSKVAPRRHVRRLFSGPSYSLGLVNSAACLDRGELFYLQLELFYLQLSFFAYSPLRPLLDALSHCKQKTPTVRKKAKAGSKKAPTVSKKALAVSKKAPIVSKKLNLSTVSKWISLRSLREMFSSVGFVACLGAPLREMLSSVGFVACLWTLAHRNRSDFCDLRLRCPSRTREIAAISETRESSAALRFKGAMESR